jgi:hypothetical protein
MNANELRLGNYVAHSHIKNGVECEFAEVESIWFTGLSNHYGVGVDKYSGTNDSVKPIPLTEEWLLKFGFEKALNGWWCPDEVVSYKEGYAGFGTNTYTQIKHVHQLQNLYFALTGKELEIKQP